ncbi:divergent polysaccharide deacetylase family protein [Brevibacillus sp. NRS-1366]|uniref:divergent polysaccharide deacetylase family protein n=1 Tax=Brevibacillus sp. NRS-1366 TaxID=3233899 RepID=UPI003D1E3A02
MYWKKSFAFFIAVLLLLSTGRTGAASLSTEQEHPTKKVVAFVIDDFGNNMSGTAEILALPVPLTVAVMPFLPSTKQDAELAHQKGHDVFVHMPMEPVKGKRSWLGPGAITTDLSDEEIRSRVQKAIDDVPHAIGMNNHMGSKVTADERIMRIIMSVVKERGLIYLDSKTTDKSVASKIATEMGVPHTENQIFLDDVYSVPHITQQMEKVCKRIGNHPLCVAIGHVGPPGKKTASVLRQYIPRIQKEAEFVTISKLIHQSIH